MTFEDYQRWRDNEGDRSPQKNNRRGKKFKPQRIFKKKGAFERKNPVDHNRIPPERANIKSGGIFDFGTTESTLVASRSQQMRERNQKLSNIDVASLSKVEKLGEAVNRAARQLPDEIAEQLKAIFTPAALATMAAVLAIYIASHATGVGQAADVGMILVGGFYLGVQVFQVIKDLIGFAGALKAETEADLDKAGECLARAIATVGIDVVMTLLTKKVANKISKGVDDLKQVDEVHAHYDDYNGINYPEGISYRQDLPKHLQTFDAFTQKNGIGGAHNLDAFNQAVAKKGIEIITQTEHPKIKGIYQIRYKVPKLDKQLRPTGDYKIIKKPKTVYDPAIHSDDKILQLSQEAAVKGLDNAIADGKRQFTQKAGGITFRVYVDIKTKTITNIHPDFNNGL